jgi:hypothetical protein
MSGGALHNWCVFGVGSDDSAVLFRAMTRDRSRTDERVVILVELRGRR